MIERGFNCADSTVKEMTDFFETRVENSEPKEDKNIFQWVQEKKKAFKKRKRDDYNSSVVVSSEESSAECGPSKRYCILHGKYSHYYRQL